MISTVFAFCKTPELIENYDKAIKDTSNMWDCHHRLETHNSDGQKRSVNLSWKELVALDMYYDRPPEELIFLTRKEHNKIHEKKGNSGANKGIKFYYNPITGEEKGFRDGEEIPAGFVKGSIKRKHTYTEEQRKQMSISRKGRKAWNKGKKCPSISKGCQGRPCPNKGKHWKLVDGKRVYS